MAALEIEKQDRIFDRIKELTTLNPAITNEAIDTLKFTDAGKKAIEIEEQKLNRKLEVEDFRQIKVLRSLVIDTIFIKNIASFSDILKDYEAQVTKIKQ